MSLSNQLKHHEANGICHQKYWTSASEIFNTVMYISQINHDNRQARNMNKLIHYIAKCPFINKESRKMNEKGHYLVIPKYTGK
jgi:hypothetical protein